MKTYLLQVIKGHTVSRLLKLAEGWVVYLFLICLTIHLFLFYTASCYTLFFRTTADVANTLDVNDVYNTVVKCHFAIDNNITFITCVGFALMLLFAMKLIKLVKHRQLLSKSLVVLVVLIHQVLEYATTQKVYMAKMQLGIVSDPWTASKAFCNEDFILLLIYGYAAYIFWLCLSDEYRKRYESPNGQDAESTTNTDTEYEQQILK